MDEEELEFDYRYVAEDGEALDAERYPVGPLVYIRPMLDENGSIYEKRFRLMQRRRREGPARKGSLW